jgi:hypothetical protein
MARGKKHGFKVKGTSGHGKKHKGKKGRKRHGGKK